MSNRCPPPHQQEPKRLNFGQSFLFFSPPFFKGYNIVTYSVLISISHRLQKLEPHHLIFSFQARTKTRLLYSNCGSSRIELWPSPHSSAFFPPLGWRTTCIDLISLFGASNGVFQCHISESRWRALWLASRTIGWKLQCVARRGREDNNIYNTVWPVDPALLQAWILSA